MITDTYLIVFVIVCIISAILILCLCREKYNSKGYTIIELLILLDVIVVVGLICFVLL